MSKHLFLLPAVLLSLLVPTLAEEKLRDSRIWHGKNGKHFRGQFVAREGEAVRIVDTRGKLYKVPLTSLSEDDLKWFKKAWAADQEKKTQLDTLVKPGSVTLKKEARFSDVAPIGYEKVPDEKVVRANLPVLSQSEYHDDDFNCIASSLVPFFLWWHSYKVVDVPSRRDDHERRVKWLYKELNKLDFRVGRMFEVSELDQFCRGELKTRTCFEVVDLRNGAWVNMHLKVLDRFSPAFLSQFTRGANATLLSVRVYKNGSYQWMGELPLVNCEPDGKVTFYMFGDIKLTGKLVKLPLDEKLAKKRGDRLPRYEIKINNMADTEQWFQDREYTFFLEGSEGTGLVVIKPYKSQQRDGDAAKEDK